MQDILSLSAVQLGKKIAAGEITSVEATGAYLERIGAVDKDINAYITVMKDEALKAAEEADKLIAEKTPFPGAYIAIGGKDFLLDANRAFRDRLAAAGVPGVSFRARGNGSPLAWRRR